MTNDPFPRLKAALADRYSIERELGAGGMATVYLAHDFKHNRKVALKVLKPALAAVLGAERFLKEIEVTANLQHPNILPLYDSGRSGDFLYYVMPYVEGDSLRDKLSRDKQLGVDETIEIVKSVAAALSFAHARGVVHRDIKPENILLQAGQAIVADFGIALAVAHAGDPRLTETGLSLGTPHYMSPEQALGRKIDGRADQYSVACLAYEMLAGEPPFHGPTAQALIARHVHDPVPVLGTVRPGIAAQIERAITKGMSKTPADRFESVDAFVEALTGGRTTPGAVPVSTTRRWWLIAAAVIPLLIIGVFAWPFGPGENNLDRNRVMVFPLVVAAGGGLDGAVGEDLSTMIGHALDGAGTLRWIDAWPLMDGRLREDVRGLTAAAARRMGESKQCGFLVMGRVVSRGDSIDVLLDLTDVAGDSVVARARASGIPADAWRVGLHAVNGLLPALIERSVRSDYDLLERNPAAVAHFLTGERHFRRAQAGPALEAYGRALTLDSTFAKAAMRGAQAATWEHEYDRARAMVELALRLPLIDRDRHFARGFLARLRGDADEALQAFEAALADEPEFIEAWMLIGETFRHLAPRRSGVDSAIQSAMRRALLHDSTAVDPLLHILEIHIRNGELAVAEPLMARFRAANPDPQLVTGLTLATDCVRNGPRTPRVLAIGRDDPTRASIVANWLANGGAQIECSIAMWQSILRSDTGTSRGGLIDAALTGLHNAWVAQGRYAEALRLLDSARVSADAMRRVGGGEPRWNGETPVEWDREVRLRARSLLMLDEIIGIDVGDRSLEVVEEDRAEWGPDYARAYADGLWRRAVWEAWRGELGTAEALRDTLRRRTVSASERVQSLVAVLPAHLALARGDTAEALRGFAAARPVAPQANLNFHFAYAMGLERLLESRLLFATGRYHDAIVIASLMDMSPISYLQYLGISLEVRVAAAEALGEARMAAVYRERLTRLRSDNRSS